MTAPTRYQLKRKSDGEILATGLGSAIEASLLAIEHYPSVDVEIEPMPAESAP